MGNYKVTAKVLNGRSGPGLNFQRITRRNFGDIVQAYKEPFVCEEGITWLPVNMGEGVAWMSKGYLEAVAQVGDDPEFVWLHWPTDHVYYPHSATLAINQRFGANPKDYARFKLPGHDGLDFYVRENDPIYAIAPGEVYRVEEDPTVSAYGKHVRVAHANGFKTVYAHFNEAFVKKGQQVEAGDLLGAAGKTGNATGVHLHLTMKRDGATGEWPYNIIDPTPYMQAFLKGE